MKKVMVLLAVSFFLVSANYAQTNSGNRGTDTTIGSQKMNPKKMQKGKRRMDSTTRGNGSLYPMNHGMGRADSTNSGNSSTFPNQTPGQPQNPGGTPGTTPVPSPTPTPVPTPTPGTPRK